MGIEHVIAQIAAQQYGLVELGQLTAAGVRRHHVDRRLRTGSLERVRPGVFAVAGTPRSFEQAVLAAVLAAGTHAVASHTTAAVLWNLPLVEHEVLELTTSRPHWARMPGVRAHRTVAFLGCEHTVHQRIPMTSVARTLVDLSGWFSVAQLGRMTDRALRKGTLRLNDLRKCVAGLSPARGRHPTRIERVLRRRLAGYEPGDSDLEMRFARAIVAGGLPEPVQQYRVIIGHRRYRIDLAYPELRIAIEIDGWEYHRTRTAFDKDRARANDLVVAGWHVLRFTSRMTDAQTIEIVRAALSQERSA
jgi:REase_MTES_1575/Transcriptional regulator, AbiEi antitoxin